MRRSIFSTKARNSATNITTTKLVPEAFRGNYLHVYLVDNQVLHILATFEPTYLCGVALTTLVVIKPKYNNVFRVKEDLRCAFSGMKSRIKDSVAKSQIQISH